MAIRQIRQYQDESLHKPCRTVENIDDRIRLILDDMMETLRQNKGAGLAACQVGILKRLVVIDMEGCTQKLVNPKIIETVGEQECDEACLSFPGIWGKTIRPQKVTIQALDENGIEIQLTGEGELAKCFCHELDHLDGVVFTDRVVGQIQQL